MALIRLCSPFSLFPPTANSAPPSSFSLLSLYSDLEQALTLFPPSSAIVFFFFHLFSNNFHLSDFIQLHHIRAGEWRPFHRWCTAFPKDDSSVVSERALWFISWHVAWRTNKKQMDRTMFDRDKDPVLTQQNRGIELEHSVFQRRCYSWKILFLQTFELKSSGSVMTILLLAFKVPQSWASRQWSHHSAIVHILIY